MSADTFPCDKCGACCRHIRLLGKSYEWLLDGGTDMCRYFDAAANLCAVYPVRPLICNVEAAYHVYFSDMPYEEYIEQNCLACRLLKNISDSVDNADDEP